MEKKLLKIKNLTSSSPVEHVVNNLYFDLNYGELHALIGKNSNELESFINTLAGFESVLSGELILKDKYIGSFFNKNRKINKIKGISFLLKEASLVEHFSVAENLSLSDYPSKNLFGLISWNGVKNKAKNILNKLNFNLKLNQKVLELSNENKKKVAIAKIFLEEPDLIIVYEPTESLGAESAKNLFGIIDEYKKNGGSIIYITKLWEEALKVSDRISILSEGKIKNTFNGDAAKKDPQKLFSMLENYNYKTDNKMSEESKEIINSVFKAAEHLTSEYELNDVLLLLAKQVTKVMGADGCTIDLIDDATNSIIDTLEYKRSNDLKFKLKNETVIELSQHKEIYYSTKKEKEFNSMFDKNSNVRTVIGVPVLIRSRITGVIQIYYKDYYVYSNEEGKYLSTFARHAALAIEDTRLMGRSALLKESHHRIKNNLQSIISLVSLQKAFINKNEDISVEYILDNIISRIKSIAAVHDLLSKDEMGRSIINTKELIEVIIDFTNFNSNVKINLELDDTLMPYNKASSIALIINELVINSMKHAFKKNQENSKIFIKFNKGKKWTTLIVEDNGKGLRDDFDIKKNNSLGLSIVQSIVKNEFNGKLEFSNNQGTKVTAKLLTNKVF